MKNNSKTLATLTSAALMLPGVSPSVKGDTAPEKSRIGYHYSDYKEDDQRSSGLQSKVERYDIDIHQVHVLMPVAGNYSVDIELQKEIMSGASPRFVAESNFNGATDPAVVMSGASIRDERLDVIASTRRYMDKGNAAVAIAYSDEDDYESTSLGVDGSYNLDNNQQTVSGGLSYSDDEITPTQGIWETNTLEDDKNTASVYGGLSQILDKWSVAQFGLSYTRQEGFLTDPYKKYDSRPEQRNQWALTANYRRFFDEANASFHADYRLYSDSWSLTSHTFDFSWYQNVTDQIQLVPSLRFYTQKEAEFFNQVEPGNTTDKYQSSDYRLSSYGAWTYGLKLVFNHRDWRYFMSAERYESDADWGFYETSNASPALVEFGVVSLGFDVEFD